MHYSGKLFSWKLRRIETAVSNKMKWAKTDYEDG